MSRFRFALRYALAHLGISLLVALLSALFVYGLLYPPPYAAMLGVGAIYALVLGVDVVCGPLLTLILASPRKSVRERWLDFSLIGIIQLIALAYGLHSVWLARPVALAFERDRLVVVTANEIDTATLHQAPPGLRRLPAWGVREVGTRRARNEQEFFENAGLGPAGVSPAMRPNWWLPWDAAQAEMSERARPLAELIARRPWAKALLEQAAARAGQPVASLRYLPLTSSRSREWVALLDERLRVVGAAPVDGF